MNINLRYLNFWDKGVTDGSDSAQFQKYQDENGQEWQYHYQESIGTVPLNERFFCCCCLNVDAMSDWSFRHKFFMLAAGGILLITFFLQIPLRIIDFAKLGFVQRGKQVADWDWKLMVFEGHLVEGSFRSSLHYVGYLLKYSLEHLVHDIACFILIPVAFSLKLNFAFLGIFKPRKARHCYNGIEARFSPDYHYFTEAVTSPLITFSAPCMCSTQSKRLWAQLKDEDSQHSKTDCLIRHLFRLQKLRPGFFNKIENFDPYKIKDADHQTINRLIECLEKDKTIGSNFVDFLKNFYEGFSRPSVPERKAASRKLSKAEDASNVSNPQLEMAQNYLSLTSG